MLETASLTLPFLNVALKSFILEAFDPYYWPSSRSILFETTTVKYSAVNPSLKANTTSFALKISTEGSTEGSDIRPLTEPLRTLHLTNATTQKVSHLALHNTLRTHRHSLVDRRAIGGAYVIIHGQCDRLNFGGYKSVIPLAK